MATTETAVYRRFPAIRARGEERQCAFVFVCQPLLDCHAMVRIDVHPAGRSLKYHRVPPESGQGDVSFWYAT